MTITNEVLTCIAERRSTRKFAEGQIAPEQLDALLEAAIWAPSGGGSQSWIFTAIQDSGVLQHLNKLVCESFKHWIPEDDYPAKHRMKDMVRQEGYSFFHHAPTLIIASNRPNYENAMADCALALENIFLAAQSMGLGSCYINQLHWLRDDEGVRAYLAELGIPRGHTICSSAAIGFIGSETKALPRKEGAIRIIR